MNDWRIELGDCIEVLATFEENSIDAVVTDPPYGIGFMSARWDSFSPSRVARRAETLRRKGTEYKPSERWPGKASKADRQKGGVPIEYDESLTGNRAFQQWCEEWASAVARVLKPGGHLLSFGGTRTFHRLVCGVEDSGLTIRDTLVWIHGQGFPKSRNLGDGLGTALKPGMEPIVLARKPTSERNIAANVARWGTGALNIDGCRILAEDLDYARNHSGDRGHAGTRGKAATGATDLRPGGGSANDLGRWPANVVLDEEAGELLDAQSGELVSGANPTRRGADLTRNAYGDFAGQEQTDAMRGPHDRGGASRFFYCAKADRSEREIGLAGAPERLLSWSNGEQNPGSFQSPRTKRASANHHPTVKPVALMQWLIRLVTPMGGVVLDPFTGSGTTGIAAQREGVSFIGIEREAEYVEIARARIVGDAPLFNQEPDSRIQDVATVGLL